MTHTEKYLARQTFLPPIFKEDKTPNLGLVVTLPAFAEEELILSLESLLACDLPAVSVEVVIIVNHPVTSENYLKDINRQVSTIAQKWAVEKSTHALRFLVSDPIELPKKHAGAGLARKIAMDEACVRLQGSSIENPVIACFDADATCSPNYLTELTAHFESYPRSLGCSINFEHPLNGQDAFLNEGIIQYELHLRYYQAALMYAKHPHAEFTVGSSMAVSRAGYIAQGGMNRRKAGEDFWFMLKLMMAGEVSSMLSATVYPSSRESFRVPFGTGRAMSEMTERKDPTFYTAPFSSFIRLKKFLKLVDAMYESEVQIDDELTLRFLESVKWLEILSEIKEYTTDLNSFRKRFYRWFNVFLVMKFFHFLRDEGIPDQPVMEESMHVLSLMGDAPVTAEVKDCLQLYRAKKRVKPDDFTLS